MGVKRKGLWEEGFVSCLKQRADEVVMGES